MYIFLSANHQASTRFSWLLKFAHCFLGGTGSDNDMYWCTCLCIYVVLCSSLHFFSYENDPHHCVNYRDIVVVRESGNVHVLENRTCTNSSIFIYLRFAMCVCLENMSDCLREISCRCMMKDWKSSVTEHQHRREGNKLSGCMVCGGFPCKNDVRSSLTGTPPLTHQARQRQVCCLELFWVQIMETSRVYCTVLHPSQKEC
jgi:hypothetical protein